MITELHSQITGIPFIQEVWDAYPLFLDTDKLKNGYTGLKSSTPRVGGGDTPRKLGGACSPLPKTLALFMTKICDIPYSIYDLTKNSEPYLVHINVKLP